MRWLFKYCIFLFIITISNSNCQRELFFNKPPVANAGPDLRIALPNDSVILDGSRSSEGDGKISSYKWRNISGPGGWISTDPDQIKIRIKNLSAGDYLFELKVSNTEKQSSKDTVKVLVRMKDTARVNPGRPIKIFVFEYGSGQPIEGAVVRICTSPAGNGCTGGYTTLSSDLNGLCSFSAHQYHYGGTAKSGYWGLDYNSCFITYFNDDPLLASTGIHTSDSVIVKMVPQTYITLHLWDSSGIGTGVDFVRAGYFSSCGYYPSESIPLRENIDTTFPYLVFGNVNNLFTILGPPDTSGVQNPYYQNLYFIGNGGNGTIHIVY